MFSAYQRRLLRVPNGMIFGVCAGIGRRLGISTFLVRLVTFIAFCASGFFPIGLIYLVAGLIMPDADDKNNDHVVEGEFKERK